MENASQAIIMAGGVLLTILIITIILILYMTFNNTTGQIVTTWDATELTKYNSSFIHFSGRSDVTAQEIVSLIALSQQRGKEINILIDGTNAKSWDTDRMNKFLKDNILTTTVDNRGVERKQNTFSCIQDALKYDNYGRVCEIRFKKN